MTFQRPRRLSTFLISIHLALFVSPLGLAVGPQMGPRPTPPGPPEGRQNSAFCQAFLGDLTAAYLRLPPVQSFITRQTHLRGAAFEVASGLNQFLANLESVSQTGVGAELLGRSPLGSTPEQPVRELAFEAQIRAIAQDTAEQFRQLRCPAGQVLASGGGRASCVSATEAVRIGEIAEQQLQAHRNSPLIQSAWSFSQRILAAAPPTLQRDLSSTSQFEGSRAALNLLLQDLQQVAQLTSRCSTQTPPPSIIPIPRGITERNQYPITALGGTQRLSQLFDPFPPDSSVMFCSNSPRRGVAQAYAPMIRDRFLAESASLVRRFLSGVAVSARANREQGVSAQFQMTWQSMVERIRSGRPITQRVSPSEVYQANREVLRAQYSQLPAWSSFVGATLPQLPAAASLPQDDRTRCQAELSRMPVPGLAL
jgi:hypothetical protein